MKQAQEKCTVFNDKKDKCFITKICRQFQSYRHPWYRFVKNVFVVFLNLRLTIWEKANLYLKCIYSKEIINALVHCASSLSQHKSTKQCSIILNAIEVYKAKYLRHSSIHNLCISSLWTLVFSSPNMLSGVFKSGEWDGHVRPLTAMCTS